MKSFIFVITFANFEGKHVTQQRERKKVNKDISPNNGI